MNRAEVAQFRPVADERFLMVTPDHLRIAGSARAAHVYAALERKAFANGPGVSGEMEVTIAEIQEMQGVLAQSRNTLKSGMADLARRGVLHCRNGRGFHWFVRLDPERIAERMGATVENASGPNLDGSVDQRAKTVPLSGPNLDGSYKEVITASNNRDSNNACPPRAREETLPNSLESQVWDVLGNLVLDGHRLLASDSAKLVATLSRYDAVQRARVLAKFVERRGRAKHWRLFHQIAEEDGTEIPTGQYQPAPPPPQTQPSLSADEQRQIERLKQSRRRRGISDDYLDEMGACFQQAREDLYARVDGVPAQTARAVGGA